MSTFTSQATTTAYAYALTLNGSAIYLNFMFRNLSTTNSITLMVQTTSMFDPSSPVESTYYTVLPGTILNWNNVYQQLGAMQGPYSKIDIFVKSTIPGLHATYDGYYLQFNAG